MELIKVTVNEDDVTQIVHLNPTMIGAVMISPIKGLTRLIMSGGQVIDVEEKLDDLLARLRLVV